MKSQRFNIYIKDDDLVVKIKEEIAKTHTAFSWVVCEALRQYFDNKIKLERK